TARPKPVFCSVAPQHPTPVVILAGQAHSGQKSLFSLRLEPCIQISKRQRRWQFRRKNPELGIIRLVLRVLVRSQVPTSPLWGLARKSKAAGRGRGDESGQILR